MLAEYGALVSLSVLTVLYKTKGLTQNQADYHRHGYVRQVQTLGLGKRHL